MARKTATEKRIEELKALQAKRGGPMTVAQAKPTEAPALRLVQVVANETVPRSIMPRTPFEVDAIQRETIQNLQNHCAMLAQQLIDVRGERDGAKEALKECRDERNQFELEVSDLRDQVETAKKEVAESEKAVETLESEKEELEAKVDPDKIAERFHEWMRDAKLVSPAHDYPFGCTGTVYMTSLAEAAEWAVQ